MSHDSHGSTSTTTSSSGGGGHMSMAFHAGITDTLYSESWTPSTTGQYTGTIIFLIALAILQRFLSAYKNVQEVKWARADEGRVIVVAGMNGEDGDAKGRSNNVEVTAIKKASSVKSGASNGSPWSKPWRISTDLPRAALQTMVSGVGYLLMLAVMTFNVGYFMAVLAGLFVGELAFGRFIKNGEH